MSEWQLKTPVAFIIFNRPDTTERVFAEIAKARPPKLLVVADGPRENRAGEEEKCAATRAIIERVDWECEVLTNFSDRNLGCKRRVSTGIDWVFEQVEEAIILEDDCLPDPTFFRFCQEMLARYRGDQRIGMISGNNFQHRKRRDENSYYFSHYAHIWGWATWRDRWSDSYDVSMKSWLSLREDGWLEDLLGRGLELRYWTKVFDKVAAGEIDTWDFQWLYANWISGRLVILPNVNLISNIGFGPNATHTTDESEFANMATEPLNFPIAHPRFIIRNTRFDQFTFKSNFLMPLHERIRRRIARTFRRS